MSSEGTCDSFYRPDVRMVAVFDFNVDAIVLFVEGFHVALDIGEDLVEPSSSRGTFCPRRSSRSLSENWTEGVLADLLLSYPFEVCCEELSDVLDLLVHHVEPVDSETPCDYRYFDTERFCDFGSEYSTATEFHPTVSFLVCLQLDTWFGEWEVVWLEPDLVSSCHFTGKHFQNPQQVA